jgi:hypothetical protein
MLCQRPRMHRACGVIDPAYTVHAVLMIACKRACGVNDPANIVYAVSMTQHAFLVFCIALLFCIYSNSLKLFENFILHAMTPYAF